MAACAHVGQGCCPWCPWYIHGIHGVPCPWYVHACMLSRQVSMHGIRVHGALSMQGNSSEALAATKSAYEAFLGNPENLKAVRDKLAVGGVTWGGA